MKNPFVHLHVHTEYSLLDGAIRCDDLVRRASKWGCPAVAITDHGALYGAIEFYAACREAGIRPVIGCELYVDPRGHTLKDRAGRNYHLVVWAENQEGYQNLIRMVSIANTDGFYYKPRVDHDLLSRFSGGLIASSACLAGEIPSLILEGSEKEAAERAILYRDIFGKDNFFLEIMHNSLPEQAVANRALIKMSESTGIPLVATNDAHYPEAGDASWHDVLLCVQTNATVNTPNRYRFGASEFYLRSPEEMWDLFGAEVPGALTRTVEIAGRCDVSFSFGSYRLPRVKVQKGATLEEELEINSHEGLQSRFRGAGVPPEYLKRLEYELGVISQMGFAGYFLIVSDIIHSAKEESIPVGPGRGSAAGSLVAYSLRITEIDPLKYGLLFERFLNPERISMPDIDTDISDRGRDRVLEIIVEKYGRSHVAQIITFDRMKSKAAIRDVGRALDMRYSDVDRIAKLIPTGAASIREAIEQSPDIRQALQDDPSVVKLLDYAARIEGLARHCSQHAAGVVITPEPITEIVPIRRIGEDQIVTQYAMDPLEKLGLVKMDFLGLRTLSMIEETIGNIVKSGKQPPDMYSLPPVDQTTFEMLCRADTLGVFQLESSGMRQLLKQLRPDCFEDIIAVLALYRPGPLGSGMVEQYVDCKHGRREISWLHDDLKDILAETYGMILYQEQVMQCAAKLAGYTLGEADLLRRAMGKKKTDVMETQRRQFVAGCIEHGVKPEQAEHIFDIVQEFAGYGFNKSHSAAYAMITYQTAYLKAHFPCEFNSSFLSSHIHSKLDVLAGHIRAVRNSGLKVLPPDVNRSESSFSVDGDDILFGLGAVSKVGQPPVDQIIRARKDGRFSSLWDFIKRVDLRIAGRAVIENLIRAGAFDGVTPNRRQLLESLPGMLDIVQRRTSESRRQNLLGLEDEAAEDGPVLLETEDYDFHSRMDMEKEATGLYISGHPFDHYETTIAPYLTCTIPDLSWWRSEDCPAVVAGILVGVQERYTKKGDRMGILEIEDSFGKVEVVCFPRMWATLSPTPEKGKVILVKGSPRNREGLSVVAETIIPLDDIEKTAKRWLKLRISLEGTELNGRLRDVYRELKGHPGDNCVLLDVTRGGRKAIMKARDLKVNPSEELTRKIFEISGGGVEVV
ncbi:MAG: DNA polymerase III subunit alpha [Thermovirgaceae bacterium]|nr:DNA polymerase III subunit alpha [Thermovirgaceae bacterium]